ncbi:MAG: hypothetical protein QM756_30265 [Polyangiaceae bacterium]
MMRFNRAWTVAAFAACFSSVSLLRAQDAKSPAATAAPAASAGAAVKATTSASSAAPAAASASAAAPAAAAPAAGAAATTSGAATTATTTSATTTSATTPAGSSSTAGIDGATYVVRLRDLEQRIDELKEQIRRSHTRLSLLSDTILSGGVGGARAEIAFKNDVSNAFRLTGAVFVLDGVVQYNKQDDSESGLLASQKEIPIFSGSIPPGDHSLQVVLHLHGYGYGVFSYLRSYKFDVRSSHTFTVTEGKTVSLEVIAWEKGDVTTPLEQRPAIRFTENMKTGGTSAEAPPPAAPPAAAPAAPGAANVSGGVSVGAGTGAK